MGILKFVLAIVLMAVLLEVAALTRGTPGPILQQIGSR